VNNKNILVSAIVSTYNSELFIRGKIEDLLAQTIVESLEIIIINSGSQQNEDAIIKEYMNKYSNIKYIKTDERETIYKAWNRGIKIAQGKFITNANTDDRLKNDAYEVLSSYLIENPKVGLVYANQYISKISNESFNEASKNKIIQFPDYNKILLLDKCIIGSQPMWRSKIHFEDNIWFCPQFEVCGDHDFENKVAEKYKIHHLHYTLGTFYKSSTYSNKLFENAERNRYETQIIHKIYVNKFLSNLDNKQLKLLRHSFFFNLKIPFLFYIILIRLERLILRDFYPKIFMHSVEFVYYFNIILLNRMDSDEKVKKLCRKYLRYKNSELIEQLCKDCKKE